MADSAPLDGLVFAHRVLQKLEKIPTRVFETASKANKYVANEIAKLIRTSTKKPVVLGLATGSTPKGVYAELVRMHREEGLSFKDVVTFNLDEYYPMRHDSPHSYHRFMDEQLFKWIDIPRENIHIPSGEAPEEEVERLCAQYEANIVKFGGIDIQILGIGRTGHVGFNEPGSSKRSITRMLYLDKKTRLDAASDFFSLDAVPQKAVTMGVSTILGAKRVFLLAFSESKSSIIKRAVEGPVDDEVAASYLQDHPAAEVVLDTPASLKLSRVAASWTLLGASAEVKLTWTDRLVKQAVIWLALLKKKPILKLTPDDYIDNHLNQLLNEQGPAHKLNVRVFSALKATITGWPGGKPNHHNNKSPQSPYPASDFIGDQGGSDNGEERTGSVSGLGTGSATTRQPTQYGFKAGDQYSHINPEVNPHIDNSSFPKRVLIFSPHPDDDVISMGGTLIRLVEQGHQVHVAYQTSGNYAVWDEDAIRFANFASQFAKLFNVQAAPEIAAIEKFVEDEMKNKKPGQMDSATVQRIKGLIRSTEARSAARYCGVLPEHIHFLNLPFYETGGAKKKPLGPEDTAIVADLLKSVKPHQIYAAGDLSDPHGTHRVCLQAIMNALQVVKTEAWFSQCQVWLYRGAWQEWDPEDIQMTIPMSPHELLQKRYAIFKHQSQKDPPPFPGADPREFWQRAEDRNRATAALLDRLGLPEYEAVEAFVRYDIDKPNDIPL
jgi:glucosamine-6-phosphate deaminase